MAYDRAKRFPKLITQTPARVGPSTYDRISLSKPPRDLDSQYPFLSGSRRQTLNVPRDAIDFPGPCSYDPVEPQRRIPERGIGGVSIDYTEVRSRKIICDVPGPGEYDLPNDLFKQVPRKIKSHPGTWRGPAGKLWLIKPPRSIMITGVSVPSKREIYGYSINEYGILVKNVPEKELTFISNVPTEEGNFTTLRYKGNFWSRMTGRKEERHFVMPGPGDYEHETKRTPAQIYDEKFREIKRATSRQLRFLEAMYQRKLREGLPGPNKYDPPKSAFDKYKKIHCKCDKYSLEPPPFGRTAKRFSNGAGFEMPGPGTYQSKKSKNCFIHVSPAPFGSLVSRFKKAPDYSTPAPGKYHTEIGNVSYESSKRFANYYCSKPISTVEILMPKLNKIGDYELGLEEPKRSQVFHAVFKSRTERFHENRKRIDVPDPGAYEALTAFKVNRDRCDFLCRRLAPPFLSRERRVLQITKGIDMTVPAPTRYTILYDISKGVKGGVIPYSRCDKERRTKAPGPQHYCINPYLVSSILKKSFNVTLGKAKMKGEAKEKKGRLHRGFTKRTLRWFVTSAKDYRHCSVTCPAEYHKLKNKN